MNRNLQELFKNSNIIECNSEPETEEFGLRFSRILEPGDVIALTGDLGAGKTALTKAIAKGLGVTETVTSPTFTIIKEYRSGRLPLYHFDVYRLSDGEEFLDIGGEEYLDGDGLCVIEWAGIIEDVLPEETVFIRLEYADGDGARLVTVE